MSWRTQKREHRWDVVTLLRLTGDKLKFVVKFKNTAKCLISMTESRDNFNTTVV